MTARRLVVLFRHLPEDSAVTRALGSWADSTELAATTVEYLDVVARLLWSGFSGGKEAPWSGVRVPRPGSVPEPTPPRRREATAEELAAILEVPQG